MRDEIPQTMSDEISRDALVAFFTRAWKEILLSGLVALLLSGVYVAYKPNRFEARLQLKMAQFVGSDNETTDIEDPATLGLRLRFPTTYSAEILQACDLPEGGEPGEFLGGALVVNPVVNPGISSIIDISVHASSTGKVSQCAEAVVAMITMQQRAMIEDHLAARQVQLSQYEKEMQEELLQLERSKKSELGKLAALDKLSWMRARMGALREEILLSRSCPTKLASPIYVPSKPVSPKVGVVLAIGFALGMVLGVLFAVGREEWRRAASKSETR